MAIYFAIMNFTLSGAILLIGFLTIKKVSTPNEVLFGLIPLFFGLHQFTEGFVWLGMAGVIGQRATELASGIFVYYAQGILPLIIPLSVYLIEKNKQRKFYLSLLTTLGFLLAVYVMYGLSIIPTSVSIKDNVLFYDNPWTQKPYVGITYLLTTCGALIISSSISIRLYGILNLIGLSIIFLLNPYGFTSVWCLYAAVISGLLYFYFVEKRIQFLQEIKRKEKKFNKTLQKELDILIKRRINPQKIWGISKLYEIQKK